MSVCDENREVSLFVFCATLLPYQVRGGRQLKKRLVADSDARDVKRERNGKMRKVDVVSIYLSSNCSSSTKLYIL